MFEGRGDFIGSKQTIHILKNSAYFAVLPQIPLMRNSPGSAYGRKANFRPSREIGAMY